MKSGEQQQVIVEKETQVIQIEPAQAEKVYVPQYNSAAVYGTPPPAQTYYPEANTYSGTDILMTGALSFGAGLLIGNLIWDDDSDCDWDDHYVYGGGYGGHNEIKIEGDVNIGNQVGSGNRPGIGNRPAAGGGRQRDLDPAAGPEVSLHAPQPLRLEFEADGKEEHDDADFGQDTDGRGVIHQRQAARPDQWCQR